MTFRCVLILDTGDPLSKLHSTLNGCNGAKRSPKNGSWPTVIGRLQPNAADPRMSALGTSESLMRHPANDRSWPKIAAGKEFASVCFG